ncbi:4-carboxymuconolactone decarboxylase [Fusarium oxysporum f. sp. albedinis]|nr:4-carboxymuconolactone decarboxylase [Fusarium oxysporum f. sp. albedinis]
MIIKTGPFHDNQFTSCSQSNYHPNITAFSRPISPVKLLLFKFLIRSTQMGCALCYPCSMPSLEINRLCDD